MPAASQRPFRPGWGQAPVLPRLQGAARAVHEPWRSAISRVLRTLLLLAILGVALYFILPNVSRSRHAFKLMTQGNYWVAGAGGAP